MRDYQNLWYVVLMAHSVTLQDTHLPFSVFIILLYLRSLLPLSSFLLDPFSMAGNV